MVMQNDGGGAAVDLDLTGLLPRPLTIRAGERTFTVSSDVPPAVVVRMGRWLAEFGNSFDKGDPIDEDELWSLVSTALGTENGQEARTIGYLAAVKLLRFFTLKFTNLMTEMTLSGAPSASPVPTEEPSASETSSGAAA